MLKQYPSFSLIRWIPRKQLLLAAVLMLTMVLLASGAQAADEGPGEDPDTPEVVVLEQTEGPAGVTTVVSIGMAQDAYIASGQPNTNYGFSTSLNLGYSAGALQAMRILIQFNLSSIPSNAIINSATLNIYQYSSVPSNDGPMGFKAQYMRQAWNESTVTWNNANYLGGTELPVGQVTSSLGWKTADVTDIVRTWVGGARANYGLIVTGDEGPQNNRSRYLYSRQRAGFEPRVTVDYTVSCDTVPPTASVNALPQWTPEEFQVSWGGFDSAPSGCSPSGIAYYDVQYRKNGGSWTNWKLQTTSTQATFKSGQNGAFFEFRARAVDRAGNVQSYGNAQASTTGDTVDPTAAVNPLPQYTVTNNFVITWSGTDNLSGIANYDVQWRAEGGNWNWLVQSTTNTSFHVTGVADGTYELRARATDRAGNVQTWSDSPQARTTVLTHPISEVQRFDPIVIKPTAPITESFTVRWVGFTAPGTTITNYDIYYQYENQPWTKWDSFPGTTNSATFNWVNLGLGDGRYGFESVATNSLVQVEPRNFQAEAVVFVDMADLFEVRGYMPLVFKD